MKIVKNDEMKIDARTLAAIINGEIEGDADRVVSGPCGIEAAEEHHISFLGNPKYEPFLYSTRAGIVIVPADFKASDAINSTLIRVPNVYEAVALLLSKFDSVKKPAKAFVHPGAFLAEDVKLGDNVQIAAGCVLESGVEVGDGAILGPMVWIGESAKIGSSSILHAGVKVYHRCEIGANCVIQANSVIGSDGFGYSRSEEGVFSKVPQVGIVVIEDEVEIGANCTIDRATMGETRIGKGAKLDNLIHIAHNVKIGAHTAMAAQVGVAGSTQIGAYCLVGGQVGFAGHIKIADQNEFQAQSGVASSIPDKGGKWFGYPAFQYMKYVRAYAVFKKLPQILQSIHKIEKKLGS